MSIKIMQAVWASSQQQGTALLLLLAIADNANDLGEAWPSVPTLAKKIRMGERYTRRVLKSLEKTGELVIIPGKRYGIDSNTLVINPPLASKPPLAQSSPLVYSSITPGLQCPEPLAHRPTKPLRKPPINPGAADAAPRSVPIPNLSLGQKMFLDHFNAARFKNNIQRDLILNLEEKFGLSTLTEFADWAAKIGMGLGKAVVAAEKAVPKWGKEKAAPKTAVPDYSNMDPDVEYLRKNRKARDRDQVIDRLKQRGIPVPADCLQQGEEL